MTQTATIYVLCDSREPDPVKRIRYVGRTVSTLERRMWGHRYAAQHGDRTWRGCWMRSVYEGGGDVLIEGVASVPLLWVDAVEIDFIAKYRAIGCRLTNLTDGGGGLLNAAAVTRIKIGASKRGNKFWVGKRHTPESKAKMAAYRTGRSNPRMREVTARPEVRAKIASTLRARTLTPDELSVKREIALRVLHTPEALAKANATRQTPEYRAAVSARQSTPDAIERSRQNGRANRGRKMSDSFKAACAARWTGRKHSDVTKKTMSAWQRGGDSHRAKLTWEQVGVIRARHADGGVSQHQLAREYQVQPRTINLIVHNKTWVAA